MNKPENRFCSKCKFVLTFDAYNEKVNESERTKKEIEEMKAKVDVMYKIMESSQRAMDLQEQYTKFLLHNDKMREIAKEIETEQQQQEEEREDLEEQEAAGRVDKEMEVEFSVPEEDVEKS